MSPIALETEDHSRDAAFNKALHGKSVQTRGGFISLLSKNHGAHRTASEEYFKHWDNKPADQETPEIREVRVPYPKVRRTVAHPYPRHAKLNTLP